ncbi:MAG: ThiF family adenylyltransferase [Thermoplasmata archaeon]
MPDVPPPVGLVTIVGLGAVGSVAAEGLALRGVPHLRLVDRDIVDASNLERPSLFEEGDIGKPKASAAHARLRTLTPDVRTEARVKDVHPGTVQELVEHSDLIVDGTDNLATRYVLNEACIPLGIPFLYGAARGAFGMVSPLRPPETPCFRCLLPPPASLDRAGPCATGDARVAPQVGRLLASHALRFLADGSIYPGLFLLRSGDPAVERREVSPRPGCVACQEGAQEFLAASDGPTVAQLCGEDAMSIDPGREGTIRLPELATRLAPFARVRLTPYLLSLEIPPYGLSIFPDGRAIVRGVRSPQAAQALYQRYVGP